MLEKDEHMKQTVTELIAYLESTYEDKYASSPIKNEDVIYSPTLGKGNNIGQVIGYLARYASEGFEKSNKPNDLLKAIHYCLFELCRLKKGKEPKTVTNRHGFVAFVEKQMKALSYTYEEYAAVYPETWKEYQKAIEEINKDIYRNY